MMLLNFLSLNRI